MEEEKTTMIGGNKMATVKCTECGKSLSGSRFYHKDDEWAYFGPAIYCLWYIRKKSSSGILGSSYKGKRQKIGQSGPNRGLNIRLSEQEHKQWWNYYTYKKAPRDDSERKNIEKVYIMELRDNGHELPHNPRIC